MAELILAAAMWCSIGSSGNAGFASYKTLREEKDACQRRIALCLVDNLGGTLDAPKLVKICFLGEKK